jgi:hypothetical protein
LKQIKALVGLFVVIAAFYVAFKLMPPYYNQLQFQDALDNEARVQSYTTASEQVIRDAVLKKAKENDIPLTSPDQVVVQRTGRDVAITVDYVVHVDLPIYPLDLKFQAASKNKAY